MLEDNLDRVIKILDTFKIYEMFKHRDSYLEKKAFELFCGYLTWFCEYSSTFIASDNLEYDNDEAFAVYIGHYPSSTSTKSFFHLDQMAKADSFQEYDYGKTENLNKYGQATPPTIDISNF